MQQLFRWRSKAEFKTVASPKSATSVVAFLGVAGYVSLLGSKY
jgi:hypothetical protein